MDELIGAIIAHGAGIEDKLEEIKETLDGLNSRIDQLAESVKMVATEIYWKKDPEPAKKGSK